MATKVGTQRISEEDVVARVHWDPAPDAGPTASASSGRSPSTAQAIDPELDALLQGFREEEEQRRRRGQVPAERRGAGEALPVAKRRRGCGRLIVVYIIVVLAAIPIGWQVYTRLVAPKMVAAQLPVIKPCPNLSAVFVDNCANRVKICAVSEKSVPAPENFIQVGPEDVNGQPFVFRMPGSAETCNRQLPPLGQ